MNGPYEPYYTSETQASSVLVGRTARFNGGDETIRIHAVLLDDHGHPSEYFTPVGEDEAGLIFDWVDADRYTVVP